MSTCRRAWLPGAPDRIPDASTRSNDSARPGRRSSAPTTDWLRVDSRRATARFSGSQSPATCRSPSTLATNQPPRCDGAWVTMASGAAGARRYRVVPYPRRRQPVLDVLATAARQYTIHGLIEVDVTAARQRLALPDQQASFTAFVVATVARRVRIRALYITHAPPARRTDPTPHPGATRTMPRQRSAPRAGTRSPQRGPSVRRPGPGRRRASAGRPRRRSGVSSRGGPAWRIAAALRCHRLEPAFAPAGPAVRRCAVRKISYGVEFRPSA